MKSVGLIPLSQIKKKIKSAKEPSKIPENIIKNEQSEFKSSMDKRNSVPIIDIGIHIQFGIRRYFFNLIRISK